MQFLYTNIGNFHGNFKFLNKWCQFYTEIGKFPDGFMSWTRCTILIGWRCSIFQVPYKIWSYQSTQHAFCAQKQLRSQNPQNSTYAKIPRRRQYVLFFFFLLFLFRVIMITPRLQSWCFFVCACLPSFPVSVCMPTWPKAATYWWVPSLWWRTV